MAVSDNLRGALLMMAAMAAFTLSDAMMKAVTETLPLYQAIFLRGLLTVSGLAAIGWARGGLRLRVAGPDTRALALRTLAEVAAAVFFLTALMHMPLANLSAIMQSLPLAVTLAAALVFGDVIGWRRLAAIGVGFVGVLLVIRPGPEGFDLWSVLGVASVLTVVVRDLATRRLSADVPSVTAAFYAAASVMVLGAVVTPFQGWGPLALPQVGLLAGSAVAVIGGYLFIIMAMRVGEVAVVTPFRYTSLLWAVGLGWAIWGDLPDALTLAGAGLVVGSGVYAFARQRRRG
ncbi:EamA family transporter [Rhodobacter veldkampii DSM 11550]|uniref:EamA family transporter n=1 Tax=Phaeovulum veldkampii DSM 11550 TaxID=1185920 RepID=A0A2T4JB95_9RHOB|nr:DMT family transporter [Phaeovulum veldkampii]MBK5946871.1 EamA family transporter [Phaeovulum veldkampii DSM 11550]PTE15176.1 EamA family transporter [Phaeovulum veldkampii DSM 11550]TDQ63442.1 putative membrane protein [Phaeovulum veldkampii DSM 11550]